MSSKHTLIPLERIERSILLIRGQKVMLDVGPAKPYDVPTKVLNQAVKGNISRFPSDFIFRLSLDEAKALQAHLLRLRPQIVTLEKGQHIKLMQPPEKPKRHIACLPQTGFSNQRFKSKIHRSSKVIDYANIIYTGINETNSALA